MESIFIKVVKQWSNSFFTVLKVFIPEYELLLFPDQATAKKMCFTKTKELTAQKDHFESASTSCDQKFNTRLNARWKYTSHTEKLKYDNEQNDAWFVVL